MVWDGTKRENGDGDLAAGLGLIDRDCASLFREQQEHYQIRNFPRLAIGSSNDTVLCLGHEVTSNNRKEERREGMVSYCRD